jgi:predicted TPR repeat methyltransferase
MDIYERAIDPLQYDKDDMNWRIEVKDSPIRRFFYHYIQKSKDQWKDAKILDLGCGTGWLLSFMSEHTNFAEGVEPSKNNIKIAKKNYPEIKIYNCGFFEFETKEKYNLIISAMVFTHFKDLKKAFKKCFDLLDQKGELQILVPDFDYFKEDRFDYDIKVEEINEDEYIVLAKRKEGVMADIVRREKIYVRVAEEVGFEFLESVPMIPTDDLIKSSPKYKKYKNRPITHLMKFKK